MTHRRSLSLFAFGLALSALAFTTDDAHAQSSCGLWGKVTKDIWDHWGGQIKALGCKDQAECLAKADKKAQLVKDIIAFVNKEAQGSWATIGPRPFMFGTKLDGKIQLAGERLFISSGPVVDRSSFNLTVVKQGGKASGKVTVSVVNPDNTCSPLPGAEATFTDDDKEQKKTLRITGIEGKQVVVKVDAQGSVTRSLDYYLVAE
jgi:hypothetical protein